MTAKKSKLPRSFQDAIFIAETKTADIETYLLLAASTETLPTDADLSARTTSKARQAPLMLINTCKFR